MSSLKSRFEEVKLVYKNRTPMANRPSVRNPEEAYQILREHWDDDQIDLVEECKMLLLDTGLRLMSIAEISKGGASSTVIDPKTVFSIALKRRAHMIVLAHNHPSGRLKPSMADIMVTKRIAFVGKALELNLADHLIITRENYLALSKEGALNTDDLYMSPAP